MDLSSRIFACGPLGGRVHAPLSLCMHAHCAIYSDGVHARFSACGCMHISFLQYVTNTGFWWVLETFVYSFILALAALGAQPQNLWLTRGSADFFCLRAHRASSHIFFLSWSFFPLILPGCSPDFSTIIFVGCLSILMFLTPLAEVTP